MLNTPPDPSITTRAADQPKAAGKRLTINDARQYTKGPVFWLSHSIFEHNISPSARLLLVALVAVSGPRGPVQVTRERLGAMTGLSVQEIDRATQELIAAGGLRSRRRGRAQPESAPIADGGAGGSVEPVRGGAVGGGQVQVTARPTRRGRDS